MGLKEDLEENPEETAAAVVQRLHERPLYYWLKSFAEREIDKDASFKDFVSSNALTYALEYIGITPENEQSSLHLSAIFDEDVNSQQQSKNKYPTHYESETKSRIQNLNRVFIELKSHFEDHYSQIVAIKPPNSVHLATGCSQCSVLEFEKLLFLVLGAAIQGTQKQDTIRKIKRFPQSIQESLIECIKLIADNPELVNVKAFEEFQTLETQEQKKIYEALLTLIRKLILERNEFAQNQLLTDYFAGYMNCDQKRIYESKGFTIFADFDKNPEDTRLSSSMRQLREQLAEKSELLQECREELEKARNHIQELETEVNSMQQKHRTMKKARDELDALREGQDKAARLEAELLKMKAKLQETEHVYDRVEILEVENRNWQVKHDMLLDQISFLSFEKTSRENSFDQMHTYNGILDELSENFKHDDQDDRNFFESEDEEPSVKENLNSNSNSNDNESENKNQKNDENKSDEKMDNEDVDVSLADNADEGELSKSTSTITIQPDADADADEKDKDSLEKDEIIERPTNLEISQSEFIDMGENLVASTPKGPVEQKSQEVQTPTESRIKRRRRSSLMNLKRTRNTFVVPIPGQKLPLDENSLKNTSQTILYKVYSVHRRKGFTRPKKFKQPAKTPDSEKQVVPNIDNNEGNEADEELSLSPTGNQRESDLDSTIENQVGTDNDSEIYFVCSPPNSTGTTTPRRTQFGTTTAFPVTNGTGTGIGPRAIHHQVDFDFHSHSQNESHSNHLTIYSRDSPPDHETVHVPLMKISHEVQIGQTDSDEDEEKQRDRDDDASNFTFGDYNLQLNLRNSGLKPATALINKISTLSANLDLDTDHNHNHNFNQYSTNPRHQYLETSSEEDGSVWYEYGCV